MPERSSIQVPAASLLAALRPELVRHPPFAQMAPEAVDAFLAAAEQRYHPPGETLLEPAGGPVTELFFIRRGAVTGERGAGEAPGAFQYEAGDLFPVGAALARRPVRAVYRATADTFLLALPVAAMEALAARSPEFADYLNRRIASVLALSRQELQVAYASRILAEQSLETPLGDLLRGPPVTCPPQAPLRLALGEMQARRVGSILVVDAAGAVTGILTRGNVLGRVALPGVPLQTPVAQVMVQPVHQLTVAHTAEDAALLMSRHGIRHVPVTRGGRLVGVVSERDLFAMQRLSLRQVGAALRAAPDVAALRAAAPAIRRFARNLLGQGVHARQLTRLVSHLNDLLTVRLLELKAAEHGLALDQLCWLALGSEGRGEQTVATDQDNALILPDGATQAQRRAALAFARDVNLALADCGYPLCQGGIMAGEEACCLTLAQWRERFLRWVGQGSPEDLLNASIFFDLRPLAGATAWAEALAQEVREAARATPRFLKQLAGNALSRSTPLNWLGAVAADSEGRVDLKLAGTAIFVDAARLYALAQGVAATGTRDRLEAAAAGLGVPRAESGGWIAAFEFLQMLRLRIQLEDAQTDQPNRLRLDDLNDVDARMLRESLRMARRLQQRMRLDYER